jgi:hypothetical protein
MGQSRPARDLLFLVDYELIGAHETGLELIESLEIAPRAILVTSRFEDARIRERCEHLGVRLLPKSIAAHVQIKLI